MTVTVRVDPSNFNYGLRQAKRLGGRFDGVSKLWTIPVGALCGMAPEHYSLLPVVAGYCDGQKIIARTAPAAKAQTKQCWECGGTFTYADCRRQGGDWQDGYCGC